MWQVKLVRSNILFGLLSLGYLCLLGLLLSAMYDTTLDEFTLFLVLILWVDWIKMAGYLRTIRGTLALFPDLKELYWHHQRWLIRRKPLRFRYMVIIHLQSKRNKQKLLLLLTYNNVSSPDWRSLHYYLALMALNDNKCSKFDSSA